MKQILCFTLFLSMLTTSSGQDTELFNRYYSSGNFEAALLQSNKLMNFYSHKPDIVMMHGRVLVDLGRYSEGEEFLHKAIDLDEKKSWISAWAWAYLGHSFFMRGNYPESENALKKCLALNATENVNKKAKRLMFFFGFDPYFSDWKILETEHIRFHFQTPSEIADLNQFANLREEVFQSISKTLGSTVPKKIDFFVWNNPEEPKQKFGFNLGFANPDLAAVYSQKNQTLGHEMTHVITHYMGKVEIKTGLINEGVAVYFNQNNDNKLELARLFISKNNIKEISIKKLWNDWQILSTDVPYPLAGAFVDEFVKKFGIDTLKTLILNQTYKHAKKLLGDKLEEFISEFEAKLYSQPHSPASNPSSVSFNCATVF